MGPAGHTYPTAYSLVDGRFLLYTFSPGVELLVCHELLKRNIPQTGPIPWPNLSP